MTVPQNDAVRHSTEVISSLLDQIPKLQSFRGKWSQIHAKLVDLRTQLHDLSEFSGSSSNQLALGLVRAVRDALSDAVLLAARCETSGLTEGKLKTQSEVDSVMARLDRHVKDIEVMIRSGVLQDDSVSRCSVSSKKDSVRAEARSLITRLQISSAESEKDSTMDLMLTLLQVDDKNVMIAVAQGVVPVLVRLLDSSSSEMKEKTVSAIARVSMVDSSKEVLMAEGLFLLNHLLRVLESGSGFAKEKACIALQSLSFSRENARAIGSRGGISSMLEICQTGTPSSQALAAGVLNNLAAFHETKANFLEENSISALISLASSGTSQAQDNAIACLSNLASDDDNLKLLIVKEGGIECLKNFWDSVSNVGNLEVVVHLVNQLAQCPSIAQVLVSKGLIPRIVSVLSCRVVGARIAAAKAVYELGFNSKTRKEMGECGCIRPLVDMLDNKSAEEKEAASMALSAILLYTNNIKIFMKIDEGVIRVVQLLDPMIPNLDNRYPISVLESLVRSKKCRTQAVDAGACLHLQKLVEMETEGAKSLLESVCQNKTWGVFSRK